MARSNTTQEIALDGEYHEIFGAADGPAASRFLVGVQPTSNGTALVRASAKHGGSPGIPVAKGGAITLEAGPLDGAIGSVEVKAVTGDVTIDYGVV
jgi:hypothetical protein